MDKHEEAISSESNATGTRAVTRLPLKTNTTKNRKFFKSKPQRIEPSTTPTTQTEIIIDDDDDLFTQRSIRTYTNIKKHPPNVVESFALPDEPIVSLTRLPETITTGASKGPVKIINIKGNGKKNVVSSTNAPEEVKKGENFTILQDIVLSKSAESFPSPIMTEIDKKEESLEDTVPAAPETRDDIKIDVSDDESNSSISSIASKMSAISDFNLEEHMQVVKDDEKDERKSTDYISSDDVSFDDDSCSPSNQNSDLDTSKDSIRSEDDVNALIEEELEKEIVEEEDNKMVIAEKKIQESPKSEVKNEKYIHWRKRAALKASENLDKEEKPVETVKENVNVNRRSLRSLEKQLKAGNEKSKQKVMENDESLLENVPDHKDSLNSSEMLNSDYENSLQEPKIRITRNMSMLHKMYGMSDESFDESDAKTDDLKKSPKQKKQPSTAKAKKPKKAANSNKETIKSPKTENNPSNVEATTPLRRVTRASIRQDVNQPISNKKEAKTSLIQEKFKVKIPMKKKRRLNEDLGDISDDLALIKQALGNDDDDVDKETKIEDDIQKPAKRIKLSDNNVVKEDGKEKEIVKAESSEVYDEQKEIKEEEVMDTPPVYDVEIKTEPLDDDTEQFDAANISEMSEGMHFYQCGDIIYGKLGAYPFWPCMIMEEEVINSHLRQISVNGKHKMYMYHVRFFGDNGRRSWIRQNMILPLYGMDDLKKLVDEVKKKPKNRKGKIKFYDVPAKLRKLWELGMNEAISLLDKSIPERYDFFHNIVTNKRKARKSTVQQMTVMSITAETDEVEIKQEKLSDDEYQEDETIVKPPAKKTRRSVANKTEKAKKEDKPVERLLTEDEIKKEYDSSDLIAVKTEVANREASSEYSLSDTDSSSKWSASQLTDDSQKELYKRNILFKGVSSVKVCQICLLSIGVVKKCRGKCCGFYHVKCAKESIRDAGKDSPDVDIVTVKSKLYVEPSNLNLTADKSLENMTLAEKIDFKLREIMAPLKDLTIYIESSSDSGEFEDDDTTSERSGTQTPVIEHVTGEDMIVVNKPIVQKKKKEEKPQVAAAIIDEDFKCAKCAKNHEHSCFVCGKVDGAVGDDGVAALPEKCSSTGCGKCYHMECLKYWPQTQCTYLSSKKDTFICPSHVCHICVSDNPGGSISKSSDKVVRCMKCPATYHKNSFCIPAGTKILSTSQIICPRHLRVNTSKTKRYVINTTWCFICSKGGDLICCESCPTCVHTDCMIIKLRDDDTFYCEDCQNGRLPLYDEIVWAKMGSYRWWPALILFPNDIPLNIRNMSHNSGEFVVRFFGTHNYYWIGSGRVFLFQEGDSGAVGTTKKRVDKVFQQSVEEAASAHAVKQSFKRSKEDMIKTGLKPPPYIRIKVNKPVGNVKMFDGNVSNTNPCNCSSNMESPCGPYANCINRLLMTECDEEVCPAGDKCENQKIDKRIYPPLQPFNTYTRGWGLKSKTHIKKGDFVIEYVGEIIDDQECQRRIAKMHEKLEDNYYFLTIDKDKIIDAGPKGNLARFMNHCCQPNCETQKWTVKGNTRVGLFAVEDIPPNTELTFNYNLECVSEDKKICTCGAATCTGYIGAKPKVQNEDKKMKKKKKPSPVRVIQPPLNEPCFICGNGNETHPCTNKVCTKTYHLKCVELESWPNKWSCPCHYCNICAKRTIRCCIQCTNSYCPSHSEGNIRFDKLIGYVCFEHDPSKETQDVITNITQPAVTTRIATEENDVTSTTQEDGSDESTKGTQHEAVTTAVIHREEKGKTRKRKLRTSLKSTQINSTDDYFEKTLEGIVPRNQNDGHQKLSLIKDVTHS